MTYHREMHDPKELSQDELQSILWDILEECINGRTEGHKCPFCQDGDLECTVEEDVKVMMKCPGCRRFYEGRLA